MLRALRTFARARDGLAAVEFGLIAPVLLTLLLGTVELCNALECHAKVTELSSAAADLVAQETTVSSGDMDNIFDATTSVLYPFPTNAQVVVTSILSDGNGGGKVGWSVGHNATPHTTGDPIAVPNDLMDRDSCAVNACSVILAEVTYDYHPPFDFIFGSVDMTDIFYAHPRKSATVSYSG